MGGSWGTWSLLIMEGDGVTGLGGEDFGGGGGGEDFGGGGGGEGLCLE